VRSRIIVGILTLVSLFYLVLIGIRGIGLIVEGGFRNIAFGIAVLLIPAIAGGLIVREIRFGYDTVQLGRTLSAEDGIPLARRVRACGQGCGGHRVAAPKGNRRAVA
jgi:hypothetical protein